MRPVCRTEQRGLTLLELLIVLLLMGLLMALVAPRVGAQLEGAQQRALQRNLRSVIEGLPLRAFHAGTAMEVTAEDIIKALGDQRSAGLKLELAKPLHYGATGVASGGELRVSQAGKFTANWHVEAVTGRLIVMRESPHHAP